MDGTAGGEPGRVRASGRLRGRHCRAGVDPSNRRRRVPHGLAVHAPLRSTLPGPKTLEDGTILRYDNAHEDTNGHERHAAPDPEPDRIEFPGIEPLYERFWDEIPKPRFGPTDGE